MTNAYFQMDVRTASPEALVSRLYERAIRCTRQAGELSSGDPTPERAALLRKSLDIVSELRNALDFERGGEIARNLDALYEFVNERLVRAGIETDDRASAEALRILEILAAPWRQLAGAAEPHVSP